MAQTAGIFGGAFDPVHRGHVACIRSFLQSGLIDRILILPTPHPPHKEDGPVASFEDRYNMLLIACSEFGDRVEVSDLERTLDPPSYTVRTLRTLQKRHPKVEFKLCIGEDSLVSFSSWYRYREILERTELLVAERPGFSVDSIPSEILDRATFVDHTPVESSSTTLRRSGSGWKKEDLPSGVFEYITEHELYKGDSDNDNGRIK